VRKAAGIIRAIEKTGTEAGATEERINEHLVAFEAKISNSFAAGEAESLPGPANTTHTMD
jgi:hypothetical protein